MAFEDFVMKKQEQTKLVEDYPVIAEMNISKFELFKIANGDACMMLTDGAIGVRFLMTNSFKAKNSNFVINNFKLQVVAVGKANAMKKEHIAVKTKVQMVTKEKIVEKKPEKPKYQMEVDDSGEDLFNI